jgi:hypothetical protein
VRVEARRVARACECRGVCGCGAVDVDCTALSIRFFSANATRCRATWILLCFLPCIARVVCSVRESGQQHNVHNAFKMRSVGAQFATLSSDVRATARVSTALACVEILSCRPSSQRCIVC